jgi:hypothetical protein
MPTTSICFDEDVIMLVDEFAKKHNYSRSFLIDSILRSVFKKPHMLEISFKLVDVPIKKPEQEPQEPQPQEAPKQE